MKKHLAAMFLFCFSLQFVDCAHYFNKNSQSSLFVTDGAISLVHVHADRSMGVKPDEEDRFWISFLAISDVTNVVVKAKALDGTNDGDTRDYTFTYRSLSQGKITGLYMGNLPTYVDNMFISISYVDSIGIERTSTFYIYSLDKGNQGTGIFAVSTESIPEEYVRTDGTGAWDSESGLGGFGSSLIDFVKAPYNFLKWLLFSNTQVMLLFSFLIMFLSVFVGLRLPPSIAMVMLIPFFVGLSMFMGTILEGINAIGF